MFSTVLTSDQTTLTIKDNLMKLKFAIASLLAVASMSAFAADQVVSIDNTGKASFSATVNALDGGSDTITFNSIAAGTYDVVLTFSGQYLSLISSQTTLNGSSAGTFTWNDGTGTITFGSVKATTSSPFVLNLGGTVTNAAKALYSGEITISAVPEPTTYGMLLGGLGIMGFMARRKSKQA
jgi:hypothetical protein